jgi:hypothetical protein
LHLSQRSPTRPPGFFLSFFSTMQPGFAIHIVVCTRLCISKREAQPRQERHFFVILLLSAEEYFELGLVGDACHELRMLLDQNWSNVSIRRDLGLPTTATTTTTMTRMSATLYIFLVLL